MGRGCEWRGWRCVRRVEESVGGGEKMSGGVKGVKGCVGQRGTVEEWWGIWKECREGGKVCGECVESSVNVSMCIVMVFECSICQCEGK